MDGIKKMRKGLDGVLKIFQIALFGTMVLVGTYQILVRYLFNNPSTVSEEFLTYAFAWLSLGAAAYMFGKRGHMRMGFAADQAKESTRWRLEMISQLLTCGFAAVIMIYGGIQITSLTMSQKTASLGIPMGYVYSIVPVSGGLILFYGILNIVEMMEAFRRGRELDERGKIT
ncbi:MAG: TRAP transporter small permease [Hungatella sp.]|nr:TRAP transporter small permease [Hungatella sp.]